MRWKLLDRGPPATCAVMLAKRDEAMQALQQFVRERQTDVAGPTVEALLATNWRRASSTITWPGGAMRGS